MEKGPRAGPRASQKRPRTAFHKKTLLLLRAQVGEPSGQLLAVRDKPPHVAIFRSDRIYASPNNINEPALDGFHLGHP